MLPRSILAGGERQGRIRLHPLPGRDAHVETIFVRRSDIFEFAALRA